MVKLETSLVTAGERTQLSKWWTTPSAQAAIDRAKQRKREQIETMRKRIAEKRAALDKEIWKEVA